MCEHVLTVGIITSALSDWVAVLHILPSAPSRSTNGNVRETSTEADKEYSACFFRIFACVVSILTSFGSWNIWNRICHPRHSTDLWPDSSRRRPLRTRHSDGEPGGSRPGLIPRTVVAIRTNRRVNETLLATIYHFFYHCSFIK